MITILFAGVEAVSGLLSGSLALIGDAGHMVTDAMSLGLGALAAWLSQRPPSARHSFGLQRAEVLGALINALAMLAVVAWIATEAWRRLGEPQPVAGGIVVLVGLVGLGINAVVLRILHGGPVTLNTRGAALHVIGDLLGSVAAVTSGVVIMLSGWTRIDPLLSLLLCALILVATLRLLRDVGHMIMEGVPPHLDLEELGRRLASQEGVVDVHDLHVWSIASGHHALAAHVRVRDLSAWPELLKRLEDILRREFGVEHVTLQPEPHYEVVLVDPPRSGQGQR